MEEDTLDLDELERGTDAAEPLDDCQDDANLDDDDDADDYNRADDDSGIMNDDADDGGWGWG